jgi:hypothetical protein
VNGSSLQLQHLHGRPALHVATSVRTAGVVAEDEVLQDVIDVGQPVEPAPMEGRAIALIQNRAVEPLDDRVVVGRAGRDPVMGEPELGAGLGERATSELRSVVGEHSRELHAQREQPLCELSAEGGGDLGAHVADHELADRPARGRVHSVS